MSSADIYRGYSKLSSLQTLMHVACNAAFTKPLCDCLITILIFHYVYFIIMSIYLYNDLPFREIPLYGECMIEPVLELQERISMKGNCTLYANKNVHAINRL